MIRGFTDFVREQGVVGLAVGFILGAAVSKLVASLVSDIINPLLSAAIGRTENLKDISISVGSSKILLGNFITVTIDFIVIALVVYFGVKMLGLDRLDKKKV